MNDLDRNKLFPNQLKDSDSTECCGISVADVVGNLIGIPADPDFSYAAGFNVAGTTPTLAGEDPAAAVDGAIAFGVLPASDETFTSLSKGEAFTMQFNNYPANQLQAAAKYAQNGVLSLYSFDDVWNYLQTKKGGVVLPIKFYATFMNPVGGMLPNIGGTTSNHCTAAYDCFTTGTTRYLSIKMWLGLQYGNGGYVYMSEDIFNQCFAGKAYAFNPAGNRWISLLVIAAKRFPWFLSYIPQIIAQKKTL